MKKIYLLLIGLCFVIELKAQVEKTFEVTAGNLSGVLANENPNEITSLTLTGTINAWDIKVIGKMRSLTYLDISQTNIKGTYMEYANFPDNWFPGMTIGRNSINDRGITLPLLKTIKLPNTLEVIGCGAFYGCGLTSITFPPSVTTIGWEAFHSCSSLESLTIPSTITHMDEWAFNNCTSLKEVVFEEGVNFISRGAFANCSSLASITFPSTMELIQFDAFSQCFAVQSVYSKNPVPPAYARPSYYDFDKSKCILYVPVGSADLYATAEQWNKFTHIVETFPGFGIATPVISINSEQGSTATTTITANIEWNAFTDDSWLTVSPSSGSSTQQLTITAEANLSPYGRYGIIVFVSNNNTLKTLKVIQEGLPKTINLTAGTLNSVLTEDEFNGITHLSVTGEMDARDFAIMREKMPQLTSVDLSKAAITAWSEQTSPGQINYKADVLPKDAFRNMTNLSSVLIPETTTIIGGSSFSDCNGLTTIKIPYAVTLIEDYAFSDDINLDTIYSYNPIPPECNNTFYNVKVSTCILMVPYGSKERYGHSYGWEKFTNIVEMQGFNLSASTLSIKGNQDSSTTLRVTSDNRWSAITDQQWLSVNPSSDNADTLMVDVTADANPSAFGRMGTVTFSAAGAAPQTVTVIQEGQPKIVDLVAGTLSNVLTAQELEGITNLTIIGEIDARDFRTMRDRMPMLTMIDLRRANIKAYTGPEGTASINYQSQYPYSADAIPPCAFFNDRNQTGKRNLTSIYMPEIVNHINDHAFSDCSGLTSITIPQSVETIYDNAFSYCYYLDTIYSYSRIPPKLGTWLGAYHIFYNISTANCKLYVPYNSLKLYQDVLYWQDFRHMNEMPGMICSTNTVLMDKNNRDTAFIEANVSWTADSDQQWLTISPGSGTNDHTVIFSAEPNGTDYGRVAIVTINASNNLSETITVIQEGKPKTVKLTPGSLSSILTVEELNGITNLTITGEIDVRDFKTMRDEMPRLALLDLSEASIVLYKGNEGTIKDLYTIYPANKIPPEAFYNKQTNVIPNLASVQLPLLTESIGYHAFKDCYHLTDVKIFNSLTFIDEGAFNNCSNLTYLDLFTVNNIGKHAFYGCKRLNSVRFPFSLISFGEGAFIGCSALKAIYSYRNEAIYLNNFNDVFKGINQKTCTLYVGAGSKELYKAADQWKNFENIVELTELIVSPKQITLDANPGSSATIAVTGNVLYNVGWDQPWLDVDTGYGIGDQKINITIDEANITGMDRICIVSLIPLGMEEQIVVVTQRYDKGIATELDKMTLNGFLLNCYPNPFTDHITFEIRNPKQKNITVDIYNTKGLKIKNLIDGLSVEQFNLRWDGTNEHGQQTPPGVYICKINGMVVKVVKR